MSTAPEASTPQASKVEFVPVTPCELGAGFDCWTDIEDRIAQSAYQIFESRGKTDGHDIDDWLTAEREVLHPLPVHIKDTQHLYTVTADVPGFGANELEVRVEPFRVLILGKKNKALEDDLPGKAKEIFRPVDLANEIATNTVIAELSNGELTISMRKLAVPAIIKQRRDNSKSPRKRSAQLRKRADIAKRYAAAAKDQLQRATAKAKNAQAVVKQGKANEQLEHQLPITDPSLAWTEEVPHSPVG